MRLIIDANLSYKLATTLQHLFDEVIHAGRLPYPFPANDLQIWAYGRLHNGVILTQDADFEILSTIQGSPPRVILLRVQNLSVAEMRKVLAYYEPEIRSFLHIGNRNLMELHLPILPV